VGLGKTAQHAHWIVAHGEGGDILECVLKRAALQFDELRLVGGLPGSAAVHDHQRTTVAPGGMEINELAVLVGRPCWWAV
jgi:hypothetical protein